MKRTYIWVMLKSEFAVSHTDLMGRCRGRDAKESVMGSTGRGHPMFGRSLSGGGVIGDVDGRRPRSADRRRLKRCREGLRGAPK